MSTTTTSTTTYSLVSYRYQEDTPGQIRPQAPREEYKIHPVPANSALRLTIEITKRGDGSFMSFILKVLDGEAESRAGVATLETVDILEFSKPNLPKIPSPLKAIIGGKQLGFRYLHPLNAHPSMQRYKRFQLTFRNNEDASAVAVSIQHVCPVMNNISRPAPTPTPALVQGIAPSMNKEVSTNTNSRPLKRPRLDDDNMGSGINGMENVIIHNADSRTALKPFPPILSQSDRPPLQSALNLTNTPPLPLSNEPERSVSFIAGASSQSIAGQHSQIPAEMIRTSQPANIFERYQDIRPTTTGNRTSASPSQVPLPSGNQLPPSSLPLPSQNESSSLHPSGNATMASSSHPVSTQVDLNTLSPAELEKMVAEVILEPGFSELMEKLDRMWAVQGFLKT